MHSHRLIARLAIELGTAEEIQLLPDGEFAARDGRPGKGKTWRLDAAIAARLVALAAARNTRIVIDYDHQTIRAAQNGAPAPAAGWFQRLEYRPGSGLWATDVQWTEAARQMIDHGEYKYLSPVFEYDKKSGAITEVLLAAITNTPALDELSEVQTRAAASLALAPPEQESDMNLLQKLIASLGLPEATTEDALVTACTALRTKADSVEPLNTQIVALQTKVSDGDKLLPVVTELKTQVATLSSALNQREVEDLITAALSDGKLATQAEQDYARSIGNADVAALKAYIAATPAIPALKRPQSGGKPPTGSNTGSELDDTQVAVCRAMGIDPEEYKKALPAATA